VIEVGQLTRKFGRRAALAELSFSVRQGDLFGLVGPNGAGKTTLLRILATLLKPSSGAVHIGEVNVARRPDSVRWKIGYMPDTFGVYPDLTVREYLEFFGSVYQLRRKKQADMVRDLLGLVELDSKADEPVDGLSRGMQQRLSLARCLLHDPDLLLLDEPASGLDPHARSEIRALLRELRAMGKTIVLSSHHLADVNELCNRLLILEQGKAVFCGSMEELLREHCSRRQYHLEVEGPAQRTVEFLLARMDIASARAAETGIDLEFCPDAAGPARLVQDMVKQGMEINEVREVEVTLEDVFMQVTTGAVS